MNEKTPLNNNEKKKQSDLKLITMAADCIPSYAETISASGVINYGDNNRFPQFLQDLFYKSGKHAALIETKARMIGGNGINTDGLSDDAILFISNRHGSDNLNEIVSMWSMDLEMYGGFAAQAIWSRDRTIVAQVEYLDIASVRIKKPDPKKPNKTNYLVSDNWSSYSTNETILYPEFSEVDRQKSNQIIYVQEHRVGDNWYPIPGYMAGLNWIDIDNEISNFHRNNIKNSFSPSFIINMPQGIPTEEEMEIVLKQLRKQYEGAKNAGKIFISFSEDKDSAPQITPIEMNTTDDRFAQLVKDAENGIYISHRITNPALFGVKTAGELGNTNDLVKDLAIFQSVYVNPKQQIIERELNRLARAAGVTDKLTLNKYSLDLEIAVSTTDLLSVLSSAISNEQKVEVFIILGYSKEQANTLVYAGKNIPLS